MFLPCELCRPAHLSGTYAPFLLAQLDQPVRRRLFIGKCYEGTDIPHPALGDRLDIILEILGIRDDHRAVVVVLRLLGLLILIEDTRVKYRLHALIYEPLHMSVRELRRIALRLRRDGLHAELVYIAL